MKRHLGKHVRYFFKVALMKEVRSRTSNYCVSQKRAQIESLVIYYKNNSKKHNKYRRNLKFMFPKFTFIREHYILAE